MDARGGNTPAWLFSFVDLAFLLLIAMTQLSSPVDAPDLGEIVVPRLDVKATQELPPAAETRWQLRVHPRAQADDAPFELVRSDAGADDGATRLDAAGLHAELARLQSQDDRKPLLAPHRDSRSEDLLEAAGQLEDLWPGRRRATVASTFGTP